MGTQKNPLNETVLLSIQSHARIMDKQLFTKPSDILSVQWCKFLIEIDYLFMKNSVDPDYIVCYRE